MPFSPQILKKWRPVRPTCTVWVGGITTRTGDWRGRRQPKVSYILRTKTKPKLLSSKQTVIIAHCCAIVKTQKLSLHRRFVMNVKQYNCAHFDR